MRRLSGLVLLVLVSPLLAVCAAVTAAAIRPCPTETSVLCTWDAGSRGNGHGDSFIAVTGSVRVMLP